MSRVVSKHLFNYRLDGVWDEEAASNDAEMKKMASNLPTEAKAAMEMMKSPDVDCLTFAKSMRSMTSSFMEKFAEPYLSSIDECIHTEFVVPLRDGNDFEVPVLVHTPKDLAHNKSNAAVIYAHGGGAVAGTALEMKPILSAMAVNAGVVYFNVDYRLAPETKFPKNAQDFYCALKHVVENADSLNIDASKIAIGGDSGGGYICFATMVMLAQKDEGNLVKLAMPSIAMISDYSFGDLLSMTTEERESAMGMRNAWRCLANDIDSDRNDPLLFPAKASDEILQKMPPTVIWEKEFDLFITENTRMAHRMRTVGRLLEFHVLPGVGHASVCKKATESLRKNYKLVLSEYLHK